MKSKEKHVHEIPPLEKKNRMIGEIKEFVTFFTTGIPQKDTFYGPRLEFIPIRFGYGSIT